MREVTLSRKRKSGCLLKAISVLFRTKDVNQLKDPKILVNWVRVIEELALIKKVLFETYIYALDSGFKYSLNIKKFVF